MKVYDVRTSAGVAASNSSLTFKIGEGTATVRLDHHAFVKIGTDFNLIKGRADDNVRVASLIRDSLKIVVDA